jgi:hypothetical protein
MMLGSEPDPISGASILAECSTLRTHASVFAVGPNRGLALFCWTGSGNWEFEERSVWGQAGVGVI